MRLKAVLIGPEEIRVVLDRGGVQYLVTVRPRQVPNYQLLGRPEWTDQGLVTPAGRLVQEERFHPVDLDVPDCAFETLKGVVCGFSAH